MPPPILTTGAGAYVVASGGGGYTGPGDIVSGAVCWYGLRGYNAAYATGTNPAVDLVDQAGANPVTINILANGNLDVASVSAWVTAHSVTTIKVTKLYDQAGGFHVLQATLANMPVLTLSALGSFPAITFSGSPQILLANSPGNKVQPYSFSAVYDCTTTANYQWIFTPGSNGTLEIGANFGASNNIALLDSTGANAMQATGGDNAPHACQFTVSGPSSGAIMVDGTDLTGQTINTAASNSGSVAVGANNNGNYFIGTFFEVGFWNVGFTAPNRASLNSNQRAYWGF